QMGCPASSEALMTSLLVKVPPDIEPEARYVVRWVLEECFGLPPPHFECHADDFIELSVLGTPGSLRAPSFGGWKPFGGRPGRYAAGATPQRIPKAGSLEPLPALFARSR